MRYPNAPDVVSASFTLSTERRAGEKQREGGRARTQLRQNHGLSSTVAWLYHSLAQRQETS